MESIWVYKDQPLESQVEKLKEEVYLPELILKLLIIHGHTIKQDIELFLNPKNGEYHDPFLMKDMEKGVERINDALINREKILIWGDYDVDGVTATSLLYLFLTSMGANVDYNIPSRERDGYGLSNSGLDKINDKGIGLVITVDCGITSVEQANYAQSLGIDIVVTDHHEPGDRLPLAVAIIDPKQNDCNYPFKHLAGVGVAFKIIQGLLIRNEMPISGADKYLDIVTFGTVSDIVPLIGENRFIVSKGLLAIKESEKVGFRMLLSELYSEEKPFKVNNILFGLAPRINAAGRMGDAQRAVKLMISNNESQAREIVRELENENTRRKEADHHTLEDAISIYEKNDNNNENTTVVSSNDWHVGVIGIVASRLVEKYHRPAVVISICNGVGKGSCRSIPGVNIHEVLNDCSDILRQFGGHEYAAGLEIDEDKISEFKSRFNHSVKQHTDDGKFVYKRDVDLQVDLNNIDDELMEYLDKFEPFGPENKQPIFISKNVQVVNNIRVVGINHLRMKIKQNGRIFDTIGFNLADKLEIAENNRNNLNVAYNIEKNNWHGSSYIQLKLKDIKGDL